jgi:hypothetical protein
VAPNRRKASIKVRFITLFGSCVRIHKETGWRSLAQADLQACAGNLTVCGATAGGKSNFV